MAIVVKIPNLAILLLNLLVVDASRVPCFFIFGDSLVDNGNNNNLNTLAKSNHPPYGVDFPGGPTGRFSDNMNIADYLAKFLGFDNFIPPFATAQGKEIIEGVNYASGGAGIRSETGTQYGDEINLDKQLLNHNITISRIAQLLGSEGLAKQHLEECIYFSVMGNNDYIQNYFTDFFPNSKTYTPAQYAKVLAQQYGQQIMTMYNYGARKIGIAGLGPIGCSPIEVMNGTNGSVCIESMNNAVKLFNHELKRLVRDLSNKLTDAKFAYVSAFTPEPAELFALGLRVLGTPCCKLTEYGMCKDGEAPCMARGLHFFFDSYHPSDIVIKFISPMAYRELTSML